MTTTENIHTCECRILYSSEATGLIRDMRVSHCKLHEAAPALLSALEDMDVLIRQATDKAGTSWMPDGCLPRILKAREIAAQARGQS